MISRFNRWRWNLSRYWNQTMGTNFSQTK